MAKRIAYLFCDKQLTVVVDGRPYDVDTAHPRYKEITNLLSATDLPEDQRANDIIRLIHETRVNAEDLNRAGAALGLNDISFEHGVLHVKGEPIRSTLAARILELREAGLPYTPFLKFLSNLFQNPSAESREALYDFLERGKFPLTEDGCFLGYKGVKKGTLNGKSTLVDKHTESFDMAPGQFHEMPWERVDNNRNNACGAGFHVGTLDYAKGFADVIVIVKVNPKDCVSVPLHETTKLRCRAYEVVRIYEGEARELIKPVYTDDEVRVSGFESAETEEYKLREPSVDEVRAEYNAMGRDDICRLAASRGIFSSANEARWIGKELVVEALILGSIPFDLMERSHIAEMAVRRHLFASATSALKAGKERMVEAIRFHQQQLTAAANPNKT